MMMKYGVFLLLLIIVACGSEQQISITILPTKDLPDFSLPAGFNVEELPYQLNGPTQFTIQNEYLYVAQLNGGENEGRGQIIRINLSDGRQRVLAEDLDKPTGLAILNDALWIATREAILRLPLEGTSSLEIVLEDLPNNGRSNGTLTVTNQQTLLYETSGNRRDAASGKLWELDPETLTVRELASGLKGAYAHAVDAAGRIWLTEIADGQINGTPLPDELNLLLTGADFGWPSCYGRELAGPDCDNVRPAVATFVPHSTPTGVVVSPFRANTLLVSLWLTGEVVQLPITYMGDNAVSEPEAFMSGFDKPQHLLISPDGSLWVSDFARGHIVRVWQK